MDGGDEGDGVGCFGFVTPLSPYQSTGQAPGISSASGDEAKLHLSSPL